MANYKVVDADQLDADLASVADSIRAKAGTTDQMAFPDGFKSNLEGLNIDLMETYVVSGPEEQVIYPDEGYYGFSKVTVGAIGGDYPGGDWEPAEDETFGDDYYNVPTGNYDYSAGADAEPSYIPEIPGTGYKALFSKQLKMSSYVKFTYSNKVYEYQSETGEFYVYAAWGCVNNNSTSFAIYLYSQSNIAYKTRTNGGSWSTGNTIGWKDIVRNTIYASELPDYMVPSGIPVFCLGDFSSDASFIQAAKEVATTSDESIGSEQFIAFVSPTQILYDGSVINNADNSPMTIYELNAEGANAWAQVGTTDGTDYPVGAYTLVWNSHDLKDMTGQFVTQSKSDEPIAEMLEGDIGIPVERNETYTIEGSTVNTFVSAVQKVTGGKTPLTPTDAAQALDEYYNHPAEEGKW